MQGLKMYHRFMEIFWLVLAAIALVFGISVLIKSEWQEGWIVLLGSGTALCLSLLRRFFRRKEALESRNMKVEK